MAARVLAFLALALAGAALAVGCGGVVETNERQPPSADATPDTNATPASTVSSRRIDPRTGGLEIAMGEWTLTAEARVIRPGPVTLVIANRGTMAHGFELEGEGDSSGHGSGHDGHKIESELLRPGESIRLQLDLPPGFYKLECFVDGHDDLGMETFLEVRRGAPLARVRAEAGTNAVSIDGFAFRPRAISIDAGETVTWTNAEAAEHTVTQQGGGFSSKTLGSGGRFRFTFDRSGTYRYLCALHPEMTGTVVVRAR